jgi:hypothetical protein
MSRKSDNADERRAQVERVLQRADRQDPERRNRERRSPKPRRKAERRVATSPKKK